MAQLIARNIEEALVRLLKIRAAQHNRSADAEHRAILREVLRPRGEAYSFRDFLRQMPDVGEDEDFARLRDSGRQVEL